jgi:hypothetical protein
MEISTAIPVIGSILVLSWKCLAVTLCVIGIELSEAGPMVRLGSQGFIEEVPRARKTLL